MNRSALVISAILASTSSAVLWAADNNDVKASTPVEQGATAQPEHEGHHRSHPRPASFVEDSTRTYADGKVMKRQIEQTVSADRVERRITTTLPDGKTIERTHSHSMHAPNKPGQDASTPSEPIKN